jgi:hydroxypyruvate reductase
VNSNAGVPVVVQEPMALLQSMYEVAVQTATAERRLSAHLPPPPRGRTVVVGAGKAAADMARVVEEHWSGPLSGLVVTRGGHGAACRHIEVLEAGHPDPDERGQAAAASILALAADLGADDLLLCLLSGGGSALLSLPVPVISLAEKRSVTSQLLRSGANITEVNCVRKHLSAIKGGRLALAARPARVVSLIISDVPGDDVSVIASGPTCADASTRQQALDILERYDISVPSAVGVWLAEAAAETPKPGDPWLAGVQNIIIATPQQSLEAAAARALAAGVQPLILGDAIEGEARQCALVHAGIARQCARYGQPVAPPCVLISGGETTVTVHGRGRGGRNTEFLLALALALRGQGDTWALAADTDGIDGTEDNAGALLTPDTLARAAALHLNAQALLDDNDAYHLFSSLHDLVMTGPTRTNVNDFRAILVGGPHR